MKQAFLLLSLLTVSLAARAEGEIDLSSAPIYMTSFDEYKNYQPDQKEYYLTHMVPALQKIDKLESITRESMEEASDWYKSWDGIRLKLYRACQNKKLQKKCEEIADIRIQTLDILAIKKVNVNEPSEESSAEKN